MNTITEKSAWKIGGFPILILTIALLLGGALFITSPLNPLIGGISIFIGILIIPGFVVLQPNEASVITLFGNYVGSIREDGFFFTNPFSSRKKISLRVRNFESGKLKVNDSDGNPVLIGAVIVWKVVDSAKALFDVDNYNAFITTQSETAIRGLASKYPYDSHEGDKISLRSFTEEVSTELRKELQSRLKLAGIEVIEARISHLAYSPEIAQVMLRRQQAQAIVAARQQIVDGAIGMIDITLQRLESQGVVSLDNNRKAAMANNLLVALVSDGDAHPVINTGMIDV